MSTSAKSMSSICMDVMSLSNEERESWGVEREEWGVEREAWSVEREEWSVEREA